MLSSARPSRWGKLQDQRADGPLEFHGSTPLQFSGRLPCAEEYVGFSFPCWFFNGTLSLLEIFIFVPGVYLR